MQRKIHYVQLLLCSLFLWGIAGCGAKTYVPEAVTFPSHISIPEGKWLIRQKVTLNVPALGVVQSFDGIARVDYTAQTAQVAGLTGMGLTLFTAQITPTTATIHSLHPGLARLPRIEEELVCATRHILFCGLAPALMAQKTVTHPSAAFSIAEGSTTWHYENGRLYSVIHTAGPQVKQQSKSARMSQWSLLVSPQPDSPHAFNFTFIRIIPGYTLDVQCIKVDKEE